MKMTSAQAAKLLRQLNDEIYALKKREANSRSFCASLGEDIESVRPEYDYTAVQKKQDELEAKVRKLKHTLNVFNSTYVVPEFNMTIDEILIYIPQLTNRCEKLESMKDVLPKVRENARYSTTAVIDYRYANYDIEQANQDYLALSDTLAKLQTALDYANSTAELEIEI